MNIALPNATRNHLEARAMIPTMSSAPTMSAATPLGSGSLCPFHVIIDDAGRRFFVSGPDGPNGVRLHYEVALEARKRGVKLREANLYTDDLEQALALLREQLPGYGHEGAWKGQAR